MADNKNDNQPKPEDIVAELAALKAELADLKGAANLGLAIAQVQGDPGGRATETIPGGAYLLADGETLVNAYGRKIDKSGKPLSNADAYLERADR